MSGLGTGREPLLARSLLTALVTALVHLAVVQGWVTVEAASPEAVAAVVDALGLLVAVFWSRQAVTPVADPVLETKVVTHLNSQPEPTTTEPLNTHGMEDAFVTEGL